MKSISIRFFACLLFCSILSSFSHLYSQKSISVKHVDEEEFEIDGVLNEPAWETATPSSDYFEWFPADSKLVEYQTEIRMLYNEKYLYIGIKAYAPGKDYKTPSDERDFSISGADVINLMFDTFNDRANAYLFGINQFGVVREGLISNGGVTGKLDLSWDTKWLGESVIQDGYSISEIRIPMASFKFKEGETQWKFNSMRFNTQANTKSSWAAVPQNQNQLNLGYFGDMIFEMPLKKSKNPISIIPYITPSYQSDYVKDESSFDFKTGFDVKVPVRNSFILDLTVNPDFSSEDVVAGQNNTTRFEIKLEETRQFFIDNGDLFDEFGLQDDAQAFYSRRIGVGENTNNNTIVVPINAGVKFTGKVNNKLRIGVLDVQTGGDEEELIPRNNNLMLAAQQKIFSKSNIGFFFINRQATNTNEPYNGTEYNRVAGTDLNFFSKDNDFDAQVYIHKSFTPDIESNAISTGTDINLEKRSYTLRLTGQYVDSGFQTDLGFTKRKDIVRAHPFAQLKLYPETDAINTLKFKVSNNRYWIPSEDMRLGDSDLLIGGEVNFTSGAALGLEYAYRYVFLTEPFSPVRRTELGIDLEYSNRFLQQRLDISTFGEPLPVGGYYTQDLKLTYNTDRRRDLWLEGYTKYGSYYNGKKLTSELILQYRVQPIFFVNLKIEYDNIQLPEPYASGDLIYVGPTFNFTFTKSLFWNTDIQYSSQTNDFFINSRVQWRYAPLSDIYLTYSDFYGTSPTLLHVERGIFLKATYWFDIQRKK